MSKRLRRLPLTITQSETVSGRWYELKYYLFQERNKSIHFWNNDCLTWLRVFQYYFTYFIMLNRPLNSFICSSELRYILSAGADQAIGSAVHRAGKLNFLRSDAVETKLSRSSITTLYELTSNCSIWRCVQYCVRYDAECTFCDLYFILSCKKYYNCTYRYI